MRQCAALVPLAVLAALAWTAGAAAGVPRERRAATVTIAGPTDPDTVRTPTPAFVIRAEGFPTGDAPLVLRLQIGGEPQFQTEVLVDTTVAADAAGSASITLSRPLPERQHVYWRAVARGATGDSAVSAVVGPRVVAPWLRLVSPNAPAGTTLDVPRPRFVWSSAPVAAPPGPWTYTFELFVDPSRPPVIRAAGLTDTTFTPTRDLETNTPYRWRVTARLTTGESVAVNSAATVVIFDPGRPLATILFQNFPNPFPTETSATTCIWFDLREQGAVRLEIFDLRGNLVRTLIPSERVSGVLLPGRYGRASATGPDSGCDPHLSWDGVARDGRVVPPGVYIVRLVANGAAMTRKIVFRGR
jgi:hypothetical protein